MENNNFEYVQEASEKQGSIVRGVIGAILGAIIGAILWCVVAIGTEHIYAIIGFVVGLVVGFGYDLLKGRKGTIRMVTVLVCVILSVVLGTIAAYGWWMHSWYQEESDFIATASKQELAEAYLTEEELTELNSYPEVLKERALSSLEVTMPSEEEYFQLYLQDSAFISDVGGECLSSVFFALLGSFALILNNGKKEKATKVDSVNFDEAALDMARVNTEETPAEAAADNSVDTDKEVQA